MSNSSESPSAADVAQMDRTFSEMKYVSFYEKRRAQRLLLRIARGQSSVYDRTFKHEGMPITAYMLIWRQTILVAYVLFFAIGIALLILRHTVVAWPIFSCYSLVLVAVVIAELRRRQLSNFRRRLERPKE
jgi:hypothetical protein